MEEKQGNSIDKLPHIHMMAFSVSKENVLHVKIAHNECILWEGILIAGAILPSEVSVQISRTDQVT